MIDINFCSTYRLNNYILISEIGRGGHGVVYQAYREDQPDEIVAVKVIEDTGNLDTLLVEPEILSRLNHPNIISLKDYFLYAGKLILVTEYIKGIDLQSYIEKQGRFSAPIVKTFLIQMASALSHAHANNVIHRDLKLSNILVTEENYQQKFILLDFGISRIAEGIQMVKRIGGTYYYMAPEQLRGRPCEQSDLWSLGVCAYNLLTGIKPFEGDTKDDLSKKIFFSIPQMPNAIVSNIDPDLEQIIFHLLEKQVINRTASAEDLLEELKTLPESTSCMPIVPSKLTETVSSWERINICEIKKSWRYFWIFAFLMGVPYGIIGVGITIGGSVLFSIGQERRQSSRTILGILLMLIGDFISIMLLSLLFRLVSRFGFLSSEISSSEFFSSLYVISYLISIPLSSVIAYYLVKVRHLQRKVFLLQILRKISQNSEEFLNVLKRFVDINWGDINIHQKYVEQLLLHRRLKEAIIESKMILEIDPYNFGATLMLAHGYFEIGLYKQCMEVCNGYLAISEYCFEFLDLKNECQNHLERNYEV